MHVIRLRRPWEKSRDDGSESTRIDVPETSAAEELVEALTFQYRRSFNSPSGLQTESRVFFRIHGWEGRLESVTINGAALDVAKDVINADITDLLESHNQVVVCLSGQADQRVRLSGEVTLAIEDDGS